MKTFENFKNYIVVKATESSACNIEITKAKQSNNFAELFQVIKDNINWSISNKLINTEILLNYVDDLDLVANGFYVKKEFTEFTESNTCLFSTKVEILKANILNMSGTSSVGRMSGTSSVGRMYDTSSVGEMSDTSSVGEMSDTSSVGRMYGTSSVGRMYGTSSVGEMSDTSSVGRMSGTSLYKKYIPFGKTKLYIKKDAFEIVEIE